MAGTTEEPPIPRRRQAIRRQWGRLRGGFGERAGAGRGVGEDAVAARVAEVEQAMGAPGFWDDQQSAASVSAEHARETRRLERWRSLRSDVEELEGLAELAEEDESLAGEVGAQMSVV